MPKKKVYVNKQIAIFQTGGYLLELVDNLKPAAKYFTGHLHARPEKYKDAEGKEQKEESSLIKVVMVDYSDREKEKDKEKAKKIPSVSVYMNLEPEKIRWYYNAVSRGVTEYKDYAEKIFGDADDNGYSPMARIAVFRNDIYNGVKQNRPWYVCIENGKGIKKRKENGACYCQKDSYIKEKSADARLTDYEFFSLMSQCVQYMDAVETRYILQPMMTDLLNRLFLAIKNAVQKILGTSKENSEEKGHMDVSDTLKQSQLNKLGDGVKSEAMPLVEPDLPYEPRSVSLPPTENDSVQTPVMQAPDSEVEPDLPFFPSVNDQVSGPVSVKNTNQKSNRITEEETNKMTYEEAYGTVIGFGNHKGKTLGSLAAENPAQIRWYAKTYKGKDEKLKMAAGILLDRLQAA